MSRKLYLIAGIGLLLSIFAYGVYGGFKIEDEHHQCRMDAYDSSNAISIILNACGVSNISELTEEEKNKCRSEAVDSTAMKQDQALVESSLRDCDKVFEDKEKNPFLLHTRVIFDFVFLR